PPGRPPERRTSIPPGKTRLEGLPQSRQSRNRFFTPPRRRVGARDGAATAGPWECREDVRAAQTLGRRVLARQRADVDDRVFCRNHDSPPWSEGGTATSSAAGTPAAWGRANPSQRRGVLGPLACVVRLPAPASP